ncbi:MAG: YggT family protein [Pseudomonadota bacterium]
MENQYFAASAVFLINTVFGLYLFAVMLRLLLQWVRADFYNPISQFLVKVTNPPLRPLRRIIPGWGGVDLASILLLLALQMLEIFLANMALGRAMPLSGLFVTSVAELLNLLLNIFVIAILVQVVMSWISPGTYNPATVLLHRLTEPVLAPARRLIPPISGVDLSPLVVLVVFQLIKFLLIAPLVDIGHRMT